MSSKSFPISGFVTKRYEGVRQEFARNFTRRRELGGACSVYYRGEAVVDIWGGVRDKDTGAPWEHDTMVVVHSATKGLAAMTLAIAHSRGWLDYEQPVCAYWPEFAQQGKERITVRQLLAHQAGLFAINEPVDRSVIADLDRLAVVLARQKPEWEPGTRQGYHAISLGFYEGELLRRIDPQHRSLGQFFQDEIASPLGLDLYIRLPESIPNARLATLSPPGRLRMLLGFPLALTLDSMNRRSNIYRALIVNPGSTVYRDEQRIYARNLEVPSGGAVGTARAIARAYSAFAGGGRELGLRRETLDLLAAPATPPTRGFYDECLKGEVQFSLGFMKPSLAWPFGSPSSFGSPGAGGSLGYADPIAGIGYGYVTSQMGTSLTEMRGISRSGARWTLRRIDRLGKGRLVALEGSMRRVLLACGVLSSIVYLAADVLGALRWEGYSYVDQTISELAALDAPSRPLVMPLFVTYNLLLFAFAAERRPVGHARDARRPRLCSRRSGCSASSRPSSRFSCTRVTTGRSTRRCTASLPD